jgi:hypothetical protein
VEADGMDMHQVHRYWHQLCTLLNSNSTGLLVVSTGHQAAMKAQAWYMLRGWCQNISTNCGEMDQAPDLDQKVQH